MKFQAVPSGMRAESQFQYLVSYIIDEQIAIDAGCLGFGLRLQDQRSIKHVLLSHSHLDHIGSLPIFLDNVYEFGPDCVTVHGSEHTLNTLQEDLLNDRVWPDFVSLSTPQNPFLRTHPIQSGQDYRIGHLNVRPVALRHVVPILGFILSDKNSAIAVISDTIHGTGALSAVAATPNLKAVFLECSFPNELTWLANKSMHLVPETFQSEVAALPRGTRIFAIHIKPQWYQQIGRELKALGLNHLEICEIGKTYEF